jgi:hypothetical protein
VTIEVVRELKDKSLQSLHTWTVFGAIKRKLAGDLPPQQCTEVTLQRFLLNTQHEVAVVGAAIAIDAPSSLERFRSRDRIVMI